MSLSQRHPYSFALSAGLWSSAPTLETEAFIAPSSLLCAPPDVYGRRITGYLPLSKTLRPMAWRAPEARQTEHSYERHLQFCRPLLFFPELRTERRALRYHRAKSPTTGFIFLTPFSPSAVHICSGTRRLTLSGPGASSSSSFPGCESDSELTQNSSHSSLSSLVPKQYLARQACRTQT